MLRSTNVDDDEGDNRRKWENGKWSGNYLIVNILKRPQWVVILPFLLSFHFQWHVFVKNMTKKLIFFYWLNFIERSSIKYWSFFDGPFYICVCVTYPFCSKRMSWWYLKSSCDIFNVSRRKLNVKEGF